MFHSDAAQAVGKIPMDVDELGIDLLSFCAHKLYGPKGVGALYVRSRRPRLRLEPLQHGGGHERGFARGRCRCRSWWASRRRWTCAWRSWIPSRRASRAAAAAVGAAGGGARRRASERAPGAAAPGNLNVSFGGVEADHLLIALTDVALSTGSACSSASPESSHVLKALGLSDARIRGAVRFGLGRSNTPQEIDQVADRLIAGSARPARRRGRRAAPAALAGADPPRDRDSRYPGRSCRAGRRPLPRGTRTEPSRDGRKAK